MEIVINPNFQYLNEIAQAIYDDKPFPVREVNMTGPRKSAKSKSIELMAQIGLIMERRIGGDWGANKGQSGGNSGAIKTNVKLLVIRQEITGAMETYNEYKEVFESYLGEHAFIANQTFRMMKFWNGNEARFIGLNNNRASKAISSDKGVGLRNMNCKYLIVHFEEHHQIDMDDRRALLESIRGYDHLILLSSSNPWNINNGYISYCHENMPYDATKLMDDNGTEQFTIVDKKVFHYSRFENNPHLNEIEVEQLNELKVLDPKRARVSVYGLPGIAAGGIYTEYVPHIKDVASNPLTNKPNYLKGGIDWGITKSSSIAHLWGFGFNNQWIAGYGCWEYNNSIAPTPKTSMGMAMDIVKWYISKLNRFPQMYRQGLRVKVDYAAFGIIDLLNLEATKQGASEWLSFYPCLKHPINTRIDITTALMALGMMYMDKPQMGPLLKEMDLSIWDEEHKQNGMPKRLDKYDHHINAMEYAIDEEMYELVRGFDLGLEKESGYN